MQCNICDSTDFIDMNNRPRVRCASCGSVERTRLTKVVLDQELKSIFGLSILHIAPEKGMTNYFQSLPNVKYRAVDINPSLYRHCRVEKMDLVTDAENLPRNYFDLVIHSHVIEHIASNTYAVLLHLHRSLKETGLHVFSVPIYQGHFEECLAPLSREERRRRFAQEDHVRRFGRDDLNLTLGKIFHLPETYDLKKTYPKVNFSKINVPRSALTSYTSNTVFCLRKKDAIFS